MLMSRHRRRLQQSASRVHDAVQDQENEPSAVQHLDADNRCTGRNATVPRFECRDRWRRDDAGDVGAVPERIRTVTHDLRKLRSTECGVGVEWPERAGIRRIGTNERERATSSSGAMSMCVLRMPHRGSPRERLRLLRRHPTQPVRHRVRHPLRAPKRFCGAERGRGRLRHPTRLRRPRRRFPAGPLHIGSNSTLAIP